MVTFTCSYISRVWTDTRTVCLTQKYVESLYFFHMSPIGWMPVYFQGQEVNVLNALTLYGENEKYFSDIKKCSVWWCGKCIYFFCGWKYSKITVVLQQQQSFSDSFFHTLLNRKSANLEMHHLSKVNCIPQTSWTWERDAYLTPQSAEITSTSVLLYWLFLDSEIQLIKLKDILAMVLQFCNTEKIQIFVDSGLAAIITEYIMYIYIW